MGIFEASESALITRNMGKGVGRHVVFANDKVETCDGRVWLSDHAHAVQPVFMITGLERTTLVCFARFAGIQRRIRPEPPCVKEQRELVWEVLEVVCWCVGGRILRK